MVQSLLVEVFRIKFSKNKHERFKMANKKGFTLSEVMVAMMVLGVIAAIIVPAIKRINPSPNKVLFKKAYSTLERAVTNMSNDAANYPAGTSWDNAGTPEDCTISGKLVNCGFYNTKATTNGAVSKFCYFFADQLNFTGATPTCSAPVNAVRTIGTTTDGITWSIYSQAGPPLEFNLSNTDYTTKIAVDVNGTAGPNCTADTDADNDGRYNLVACSSQTDCSSKPDRFVFGVRYDGKIQVSANGNDACAASILTDPLNNQ